MDINQQLEFMNLATDVLAEGNVTDEILNTTKKIVSSKAVYDALKKTDERFAKDENDIAYLSNETSCLNEKTKQLNKKIAVLHDDFMFEVDCKNISTFKNDVGYLNKHQSLEKYYVKSETSSGIELQKTFQKIFNYFNNSNTVSSNVQLSSAFNDRYLKTETSSAAEISSEFNKVYDMINYLSIQIDNIKSAIFSRS